jgi:hypothetical protein
VFAKGTRRLGDNLFARLCFLFRWVSHVIRVRL